MNLCLQEVLEGSYRLGCLQTDFLLHDLGTSLRIRTLAASAPYSDGVFMITALKSSLPQLCSVFATAMAPISSTSEKISVSMIMGLGLSTSERQSAVADSKTRTARRRNDIDNMAVPRPEAFRPCVDKVCCNHILRDRCSARREQTFASHITTWSDCI